MTKNGSGHTKQTSPTKSSKLIQSADGQRVLLKKRIKLTIHENYEPTVVPTPKEHVRKWLTPLIFIAALVGILLGFMSGGGSRAEHVWGAVAPVIGAVLQYYYANARTKKVV